MKEKKSAGELWDAQSDATRIATSIAFAMAAAFGLYMYCVNLTDVYSMLYRVFETRGYAYEVFGAAAMIVIIVTQLGVALQCALASSKLKHGRDVPNVDNIGIIVVMSGLALLSVLGLGVALMALDVPKPPATVELTPLFLLSLLNFAVVFISIIVSLWVLTGEHSELPDNPVSVSGMVTAGLSVLFLISGFSALTVALWVGATVLTLLLRPVGEAFDNERHKRNVVVIEKSDTPASNPVIEMGI